MTSMTVATLPSGTRLVALLSLDAIQEYREEWEALFRGSVDTVLSTHPDWVEVAWSTVSCHDREARLCILCAERTDGSLEFAWPLYSSRNGATRRVRHLGSGSREEYAGPLFLEGADGPRIFDEALKALRSQGDVLEVYNLAPGSFVANRLDAAWTKWRGSTRSPIIRVTRFKTAEDWRLGKSANFRQQMRSKRRRLAKLGEVRVGTVSPEMIEEYVDWTFTYKARWVSDRGIAESWIDAPVSRDFFKRLLDRWPNRAVGTYLQVDGKYLASAILLMSDRTEFFLTTFDPCYAEFSPGLIALDYVVEVGVEAGLDVDLRLTSDAYKLRWADEFEERCTYFLALNPRGWLVVLSQRFAAGLKVWRQRIGSAIRKLKVRISSG